MKISNWFGRKLNNLTPAAIREIIVIIILLCISIALSIPEYEKDKEMAAVQRETLKHSSSIGENTVRGVNTEDNSIQGIKTSE